jgi:hypothetical protein
VTKRDYVTLAAAMRNTRPWNADANRFAPGPVAWLACVTGLAFVLAAGNPRFDSARFLIACGVNS